MWDNIGISYGNDSLINATIHYNYKLEVDIKTGDHVYFGEKNNQAISWEVLNIEDGRALLFCDFMLDAVVLDITYSYNYGSSALSKWCSDFYLSECFTESERGAISTCSVDSFANQTFFVLSKNEFLNFFPDGVGGQRKLLPGVSGVTGAYGLGTTPLKDGSAYWLRSRTHGTNWIDLAAYDNDGVFSNSTCANITLLIS